MIALLLTACIHPKGMAFTALNNPEERSRQYSEALDYYLRHTSLPLVCCENTGVDLSGRYATQIASGRMEYLTFDGNNYDKSRGKGYGEMEIMAYAFAHSRLLQQADEVMKITGRLKVTNLTRLLRHHRRLAPHHAIQVFEAIPSEAFIDSRLILAPRPFFQDRLIPRQEELDDSRHFWMEHLLFSAVSAQQAFPFLPFPILPLIQGTSGSTGKDYQRRFYLMDYLEHARRAFSDALLLGKATPLGWRVAYRMLKMGATAMQKMWRIFRP